MNIQIQIQVCRACLKQSEDTKLTDYSLDSEVMQNYHDLICSAEPSIILPRTFCDKCVAKIKLSSQFKKTSLSSESYLRGFVERINREFTKSLPKATGSQKNEAEEHNSEEDPELERLLQEDMQEEEQQVSSISVQKPLQEPSVVPNVVKHQTPEKLAIRKIQQPLSVKKIEKLTEPKPVEFKESDEEPKEYMEAESGLYGEEEQLDEDGNIFGEEIYDIMEIDNEGPENIYLEESGKQVLDDDSEFILVNFKTSSEDLTEKDNQYVVTEKDTQYVVEELFEDDCPEQKSATTRKKHVARMPREIIEKYAQSTENNQHICKKCVKVFSTRTNLIRHIQSHDGHKAYTCQICNKGFTQSGSLKQHMYIHSGERPYKCDYCNRAFTQGKTLKFHLRRHTEEKPFTCNECNASFRQRDGLKRHLKSRHNIELKYERQNLLSDKLIGIVNIDQAEENQGTESSVRMKQE